MPSFHEPVLGEESVSFLITDRSGVYVDGTLGGGGHSERILRMLDSGSTLVGIDRDIDAVSFAEKRFKGHSSDIILIQGCFSAMAALLGQHDVSQVDGILLDLGVSSFQIDTASRGFSYLADAPLDMRMDQSGGKTAADLLNSMEEQELARIFYEYGEERLSRRIAKRIVERRRQSAVERTGDLADIVRSLTPYKGRVKVFSRVWQALRLIVNSELDDLKKGLESAYTLLKPGGRMVVISYESLMDRMVKRFFKGYAPDYRKGVDDLGERLYAFDILTKKVVRPSSEEMEANPRSKSALMRAASKQR